MTRRGRRFDLAAVTLVLSVVFAWAAHELPWRKTAPLALAMWGLGALHALTAASFALRPAWSPRLLRALGGASLAVAVAILASIALASLVLVRDFGALGWALTCLLSLIGAAFCVATLPVAFWGLRRSRGTSEDNGPR